VSGEIERVKKVAVLGIGQGQERLAVLLTTTQGRRVVVYHMRYQELVVMKKWILFMSCIVGIFSSIVIAVVLPYWGMAASWMASGC